MSFLSIELGAGQLNAALLEKTKEGLLLHHDLALALLPGEDPLAKIRTALKDFIRKYDVTDRKVFLTVADPGIIALRNAILPAMPASELVAAVAWHAKEEGTLTQDTELFNYEVVKEFEDADGAKKIAVTFSVVNPELLENSVRMLNRLGLEALQITVPALNAPKILGGPGDNNSLQMLLRLGFDSSTCAVYKKEKLLFIRDLSFSYAKARLSLNDPLFLGPKFRTPEAEAEIDQAINSIVLPSEDAMSEGAPNRAGQFFVLIRPALEVLIRELRYSLTYFTTNYNEERPAAIFLTGYGIKFRGADAFLAKEMGMSVSLLKFPPQIQCDQAAIFQDPVRLVQSLSAAAGAFSKGRTVDFTPFKLKHQKREAFQRGVLKMVSLAAVGFCVISLGLSNLRAAFFKDRLEVGTKHLQALGKFGQASEKPFPKYYLIRELERATIPPDRFLRLLGHLMPAGLAVRSIEINSDKRAFFMELETSGIDESESNPLVEDLVERLRDSGFLTHLHVKQMQGYAVSIYKVDGVFRDD
jgi:Tfp pilus assembly PilM family ATPase